MVSVLSVYRVAGSSPRGRGKPEEPHRTVGDGGLIPAWAGKTWGGVAPATRRAAHPRVGGENGECARQGPASRGSSPRGRGKHHGPPEIKRRSGLIPAWAGKTESRPRESCSPAAHPRVGGENLTDDGRVRGLTGSSPRGRGKRERGRSVIRSVGLIPAWAGKTLMVSAAGSVMPAHPRVGGENKPDQ